jgi:hypothetical protein
MNTATHASEQSLRIGAEELRTRLKSREAATLLDVRSPPGRKRFTSRKNR